MIQATLLINKTTGDTVGYLSEPVLITELVPGDRVWDDRNDEEAIFEGWSFASGCYILTWPSMPGDGGFCAWERTFGDRLTTFRRVVLGDAPDRV